MGEQPALRKWTPRRAKELAIGLFVVLLLAVAARWLMRDGMSDEEIAARSAECRQSAECKQFGRCRFVKEPGRSGSWTCAAATDADCRQSSQCESAGECRRDWRGACRK